MTERIFLETNRLLSTLKSKNIDVITLKYYLVEAAMERSSIKISLDTSRVLEFLDYVSQNGLLARNELGVILEIGAQKGLPDETEELIFSGKLLDNMLNLRSGAKECETALFGFRTKLGEFASAAHSETLTEIVAGLNHSEDHLKNLAHDLARLKDVQIKIKRDEELKQSPGRLHA